MAGNILGSLLLNIVTKSDDSGLRKTDRSLRKIGTTAKTVAKNTSLLGSLSKKFMGGFIISNIGNWFNSYLQFEKDLGAMQSRFYAITHSEKESAEEFEYIRKLATDTALDIKKTADSYSIFYAASRNFLGKEGARGVYEAWTQVGRVLHLNDYQMERVTYAMREMVSKGAIYSQDLRMQIGTHVPNAMGLAQKAAEEMGITGVDWFTKLQESAKGNSKVVADFVQKFSKQAQLMYASPEALNKALQQPDALMQRLKNIPYQFGVKFSQAGGAHLTVKLLQGVVTFLERMPLDFVADKLGLIAKTVGDMAVILPEILDILKDIAIIYIGRMITKSFGKLFGKGAKGLFGKSLFINLGYIFRNGFKSGMKNVGKGILNFFKYYGFKLIPKVLSRFIPFLGQAMLAFDVIKLLYKVVKSLLPKKEGTNLSSFLQGYGINPDTFYNAFARLTKDKNEYGGSITELRRHATGYLGKDLGNMFTYNENGDVVININGTLLTPEEFKKDLESSSGTIEDIKKDKTKYFYKPIIGSVPAWEL